MTDATTTGPANPGHVCDSGHFDRTVCPEPCGLMHSYCDTCGSRQDRCAHDATAAAAAAVPAQDVSGSPVAHAREEMIAAVYADWCASTAQDPHTMAAETVDALTPIIDRLISEAVASANTPVSAAG